MSENTFQGTITISNYKNTGSIVRVITHEYEEYEISGDIIGELANQVRNPEWRPSEKDTNLVAIIGYYANAGLQVLSPVLTACEIVLRYYPAETLNWALKQKEE